MNVTLVMVASADGKTTHPRIHGWSSSDDQQFFERVKQKYPVIIMGRATYEAVRSTLKLSPKILRIVVTSKPAAFAQDEVQGQLEFTDESPPDLIHRLEQNGITSALLAGGADLNASFLHAGLINDCYITLEPRFFGNGKNIFTSEPIDIPLRLLDTQKLNENGTIVLHYQVANEHPSR